MSSFTSLGSIVRTRWFRRLKLVVSSVETRIDKVTEKRAARLLFGQPA